MSQFIADVYRSFSTIRHGASNCLGVTPKMRITCPSCSTSYTIPDDKIGAKGRSVQCTSCQTKWFVSLGDSEAAQTPAAVIKTGAADPFDEVATDVSSARVSDAMPAVDGNGRAAAPDTAMSEVDPWADAEASDSASPPAQEDRSKPKDIESFAKKPKIKVSKSKPPKVRKSIKFDLDRFLVQARPVLGALVLAFAITCVTLAIVLRTYLVAAFPGLASLYQLAGMPVNLRGLEIANVQMLREVENAQPVLVVEGELTNTTAAERIVPAIRFSLRGDDAQEIYAWSIEPKTTMLTPGASMRFRTRLASPPEQAADIQVRMIDRRNQQAALHE